MEKTSSMSRLPRNVLALAAVSFFTDFGSDMIFPLLPLFLTQVLGASPAFLGVVEGAADAVGSVLKVISGEIADRVGRNKPLVLAGYGIAAVVRPLVAVASAPWHVLAIRLSDRVGKGVRTAPRDAIIAGSVDDANAGRAFGFHRAMDHLGAVVGPLVAAALLARGMSLRHVFMWAAIPGVLSFIVLLGAVRDVRRAPSAAPTAPVSELAKTTRAALPARFWSLLVILSLFALGNSSDAFLLLRARDAGVAQAAIPLLWAGLHVSKFTLTALGGMLADRVSRVWLVVAGWAVYAVTYIGLAHVGSAAGVWAWFLVYGAFYGLTEPTEKALVRELAPAASRGRAFGMYHGLTGAMALPAGALTGWIWGHLGAAVALQVGASVAAAASVLLLVWGAARPRVAARPVVS